MPRAYYRVPIAAFLAAIGDGVTAAAGIEQHRTEDEVFLLATTDPAPILEALGGIRLGRSLPELAGPLRAHFVTTRVRRLIERDGVPTIVVQRIRGQPEEDDEVLEVDLPAVIFAGDDVADYQREPAVKEEDAPIVAEAPAVAPDEASLDLPPEP